MVSIGRYSQLVALSFLRSASSLLFVGREGGGRLLSNSKTTTTTTTLTTNNHRALVSTAAIGLISAISFSNPSLARGTTTSTKFTTTTLCAATTEDSTNNMDQRVSLITLAVDDLDRSATFYEAVGWKRVQSSDGGGNIVAFDLLGQTLSLYPKAKLAEDMGIDLPSNTDTSFFSGITIGHNVAEKGHVQKIYDAAIAAGAKPIKEPHDIFWGGHSCYFADLDGHVWEVAHNPFSPLGPNGEFQWNGVTTTDAVDEKAGQQQDVSTNSTVTMQQQQDGDDNTLLDTGYLNAVDAAALDEELMSTPGFSLEQLMELAGLAVAEAVYQVIPPATGEEETTTTKKKKILLVCGPGNNGGDGLVCARHLTFFGYECVIVYPKKSKREHFINLVRQCEDVNIPILDEIPKDMKDYDAIVDAIFGFSFSGGTIREPFGTAITQIMDVQMTHNIPVISVDVPSGWNVDEGDVANTGFIPQVLISLTTPKLSSKSFTGRHFIGGRFLPPKLAKKYNVQMPPYPGVSQVMEVTNLSSSKTQGEFPGSSKNRSGSSSPGDCLGDDISRHHDHDHSGDDDDNHDNADNDDDDDNNWEAQYAAYLAEKDQKANHIMSYTTSSTSFNSNTKVDDDKINEEAENSELVSKEQSTITKKDDNEKEEVHQSWEVQYAAYCAEKESKLAQQDEEERQQKRNKIHTEQE